jgi:hypothetical protein
LSYRRPIQFFSCILLLGFIFALFLPGRNQQVHAQGQGDVTLTARLGFDGSCKQNAWVPVRVKVENKGPDLNARIQAAYQNSNNGQSVYAEDVSLPTTSRKEFFLYLSPDNYLGKLNVSLMVGEREVVTVPLNVTCISNDNLIIGLLTDSLPTDMLANAAPLTGSARVALLQLADLPDRSQGWEGLDALVVSGVDVGAISDQQRVALKAWLAQGGKLLITGGPRWQGAAGGLDEFLPVDLQSTQTVTNLSALQAYFKTSTPLDASIPIVLAVGKVRPNADILVAQDGVPILVQKQIGFGTVYYLAADPGLQPFSTWGGMSDVYRHLLGARSLHPSWMNSTWDTDASNQALAALPALGLPPTGYVLCLLGLYILVIGPLNYLVLRRIKRQGLAWVTIPALVIIFTLVAYFSGYLIRGTRPILNRLAVVQAWDGVDRAQTHALVGIYSPGRTKYALQAGESFLPYPFNNNQTLQANKDWLSLQQGQEIFLPDILVESGGMKAASLNGSLPAIPFTHNLVVSLMNDDPILGGTITNTSKYTLKDVTLVTPNDSKKIGDFAPGAVKQVQVLLKANPLGSDFYNAQQQTFYSSYPDSTIDDQLFRRSALMRAALPSNQGGNRANSGIYLVGWVDDALLPTGLQGQGFDSVDTTLYVLMLSPTFAPKPGPLKLTPSLFAWESSSPDFSPYPAYYYGRNIPPGGYVLSFRLAAPLHYSAVKSLTFSLSESTMTSTATPDGVSAFLWDWESAQFVRIQGLFWGDIDIPDPSRYVGPGGEIRLKIDQSQNVNQNQSQIGSSYFTLVVEP